MKSLILAALLFAPGWTPFEPWSHCAPDLPTLAHELMPLGPRPGTPRWNLRAVPPDEREPFLLISPATGDPIVITDSRWFAEQVAAENTERLAVTGWRFEAVLAR
jgi:hypothetical protein